mgnify:CR=1 FL=1
MTDRLAQHCRFSEEYNAAYEDEKLQMYGKIMSKW